MVERAPLVRRDNQRGGAAPENTGKQQPKNSAPEAAVELEDAILQAKMSVGPAGDAYEREADDVAARVVRTLRAAPPTTDTSNRPADAAYSNPRVQRSERPIPAHGGDGSGDAGSSDESGDGDTINLGGRLRRVQRSANASTPPKPVTQIRRIQRSGTAGGTIGVQGGDLDADTTRVLKASRGGGRPLPDPARSKMESAFGADFSGIRVHSGPTATDLNERIQAKAFTTGNDIYFRDSVPDASTSSGQELLAHELTHTIQQSAGSVQRELDADAKEMLEGHIGAKARQQQLVAGVRTQGKGGLKGKHGQEMAEEIARGGRDKDGQSVDNFGKGDVDAPAMSKTLMGLVALTKYDDTASASVLELAMKKDGGKDLSDPQMWNLIVVNSRMMSYIEPGLTINKIIPDSQVQNVLKIKQIDASRNSTSVGGSVAHEMNYGQDLTGEEAVANFGLDYAGYREGTKKSDGKDGAGGSSPYLYKNRKTKDKSGNDQAFLKGVPNVFYMKLQIPDQQLENVKVPVHPNVAEWAAAKLREIDFALRGAQWEAAEIVSQLGQKKEILEQFIARSKVDANMLTTLTADGKKNRDDPLTNMGMTKPSARLQTEFGTINQEYHISYFAVPKDSGLWLKDETGTDTPVGKMVKTDNGLEWGELNEALISSKLAANQRIKDLASGETWDTD
jgi:hypothetical protein